MTHEEETENFIGHLYHDDEYDEECFECGGEGQITDECDEDCCCCADPETQHAIIPCPNCNPSGDQQLMNRYEMLGRERKAYELAN